MKQVITDDDIDYDGVDVERILLDVINYNRNCLKRFEELTVHRDENAYDTSRHLGKLLNKIETNYKAVSKLNYEAALKEVNRVEDNDAFQNDPTIQLSLTKIRNALKVLCARALVNGRGVEVDMQNLDLILTELSKHEGYKLEDGAWFPYGTVGYLEQKLDVCLDVHKNENNPKFGS